MIRYIASYGFNEENHPAFKSYTNRSSKGSYLASTLIRDLKGQLQLALTLPDTTQRPMLVGGHNARGVQLQLAPTLIRDLQGQLQLALTLPDTPQRLMLVSQWEANARGVATISINPNMRSTGPATISINPARHTSKANANERGGYKRYLVRKNSSQGQKKDT